MLFVYISCYRRSYRPEINALATVMLFVILLCLAGAYVLGRKSQTAVEKAAGGK